MNPLATAPGSTEMAVVTYLDSTNQMHQHQMSPEDVLTTMGLSICTKESEIFIPFHRIVRVWVARR